MAYSPWHLLDHLRITQWDILEYVRGIRRHRGLRPRRPAALRALVADAASDLVAVLPGTPGYTILREVRIVADHNAYDVGEFAILRQVMGAWPRDRRGGPAARIRPARIRALVRRIAPRAGQRLDRRLGHCPLGPR